MSESLSDIEDELTQKYRGKITVNDIVKGYIASKLEKNKLHKHKKEHVNKHKAKKKHKSKNIDSDSNSDNDLDHKSSKTKNKLLDIERTYKQNILARQERIQDNLSKNSKSRSKSREHQKKNKKLNEVSSLHHILPEKHFSHLNRLTSVPHKIALNEDVRKSSRKLDSYAERQSDEERLVKRLRNIKESRTQPTNVIILDDDDDDVIKNQINAPLVSPEQIPLPINKSNVNNTDAKVKPINAILDVKDDSLQTSEIDCKKGSLKIKISDTSVAIISSGTNCEFNNSNSIKNESKESYKATGKNETKELKLNGANTVDSEVEKHLEDGQLDEIQDKIREQAYKPKNKKEKSTDCDSALIPLLCVHG